MAVRVYDVAGRLVRILSEGYHPGGIHELTWSGGDDRGRDVSAGVYFIAAEVGGSSEHARILILR